MFYESASNILISELPNRYFFHIAFLLIPSIFPELVFDYFEMQLCFILLYLGLGLG